MHPTVLLNGHKCVYAACHRFSWVFKKIRKHIRNCTYRLLVISLPCLKRALLNKSQIHSDFLCSNWIMVKIARSGFADVLSMEMDAL